MDKAPASFEPFFTLSQVAEIMLLDKSYLGDLTRAKQMRRQKPLNLMGKKNASAKLGSLKQVFGEKEARELFKSIQSQFEESGALIKPARPSPGKGQPDKFSFRELVLIGLTKYARSAGMSRQIIEDFLNMSGMFAGSHNRFKNPFDYSFGNCENLGPDIVFHVYQTLDGKIKHWQGITRETFGLSGSGPYYNYVRIPDQGEGWGEMGILEKNEAMLYLIENSAMHLSFNITKIAFWVKTRIKICGFQQ